MSTQKIKINIGGRIYPLTVQAGEELLLRNAGKKINEMIKQFEENYNVEDKQDVLSMCALQIATKLERLEKDQEENNKDINEEIEKAEQALDQVLGTVD